jgi:hypothetical protein
LWHEADDQDVRSVVSYRGQSGQQILKSSFSAFDPNRTLRGPYLIPERLPPGETAFGIHHRGLQGLDGRW